MSTHNPIVTQVDYTYWMGIARQEVAQPPNQLTLATFEILTYFINSIHQDKALNTFLKVKRTPVDILNFIDTLATTYFNA